MTKTINLTGAEVAVTGLDGAHAHIRNDSTDTIYAAKTAGITAGADGVASIPAGQADTLRGISGAVYLLGTGSVLIQSDDYVESPFKASTASGGSAVDDVARAAVSTHAGNADIHVTFEDKRKWNMSIGFVTFNGHVSDSTAHTTAEEKAAWNGKAELSDIPKTLPANGGNADSVGGMGADEFLHKNGGTMTGALGIWDNQLWFGVDGATQYYFQNIDGVLYLCNNLGDILAYSNSDGFNAKNSETLENHPASDFVLKSDYDALEARVAALEGTT